MARMRSFMRGVKRSTDMSADMENEMLFHIEQKAERLAQTHGLP